MPISKPQNIAIYSRIQHEGCGEYCFLRVDTIELTNGAGIASERGDFIIL